MWITLFQCWSWSHRSLHHTEHCARKNAVWGVGRCLPNCQISENAKASHGPDRGKKHIYYSSVLVRVFDINSIIKFTGPVSVLLPCCSGIPVCVWSALSWMTINCPGTRSLKSSSRLAFSCQTPATICLF